MKKFSLSGRIKSAAVVCMLGAALLAGCGKDDFAEAEEEIRTVEAEEIPAKEETSEIEVSPDEIRDTDQNSLEDTSEKEIIQDNQVSLPEMENEDAETARLKRYQAVLTDLLQNHVYPDGEDYGYAEIYPMSDNRFAVVDIDKDGKKELILCFTTSSMAGMREAIYDYNEDTDDVVEEYTGFPGAVFYENGLIEEGASHNHGRAPMGDFWPYMLYQYQPETDTYQCIYAVDAWEKEFLAEGYPEEADTEKNGIVYFMMEGDSFDYEATTPVGGSAYEAWRKDQGLDSAEMEIMFQALTEDNIKSIF